MRKTRSQVERLYKLFDPSESLEISTHQLHVISKEIGCELSRREVDNIMSNCSSSQRNITYEEFYKIMTRQTKDEHFRDEPTVAVKVQKEISVFDEDESEISQPEVSVSILKSKLCPGGQLGLSDNTTADSSNVSKNNASDVLSVGYSRKSTSRSL